MKRNAWVLILIAVSVGSIYFAYTQKSRADQCAKQNDGTIASLTAEVDRMKKIAEINLNEAILQGHRADEAIKNCNKRK